VQKILDKHTKKVYNYAKLESEADTMKNTVFILVVLLPALACQARIITVDANAPPADFNNIQAAIDDANDGDVVEVQPGTYTGPGNRDIDFLGKAITVRSTDPNDPNTVATTIVDCNGTETDPHRGFYFHSNEDANSVVSGLTITNGYAESGGGIFCDDSSPTITKCSIQHNYAFDGGGIYAHGVPDLVISGCAIVENQAGFGGGVRCWGDNVAILNCHISDNVAGLGGGVFSDSSTLIVSYCSFRRNDAWFPEGNYHGGGGLNADTSKVTVDHCFFEGNSTQSDGGACAFIQCLGSASEYKKITNCTFAYNRAPSGSAVSAKGGWGAKLLLRNCIIWANDPIDDPFFLKSFGFCGFPSMHIDASVLQAPWDEIERLTLTNCIIADPCFADPGYWDPNGTADDPNDDFFVDGDYHLESQAGRWDPNEGRWTMDEVTSPCIDAGNPMSPIGPEPFPNGGIINMGAYGGTAEASKSYFGKPPCKVIVAGDINGDCEVNFKDFWFIGLHCLENNNP